jgi:hypothetical protein
MEIYTAATPRLSPGFASVAPGAFSNQLPVLPKADCRKQRAEVRSWP